MNNTLDLITQTAELVQSVAVILGVAVAAYRFILKQNKQDVDIKAIKEEQTVICYGLSACLDGLQQLGANHTVPLARDKLDKYLNLQAHK